MNAASGFYGNLDSYPVFKAPLVLTAQAMAAHNTFDEPELVVPTGFDGAASVEGGLQISLPPKSVVVLSIS